MHLPELPNNKFHVRPDEELPDSIVNDEFNKIWTKEEYDNFEDNVTLEQEESIKNGIPTQAMANAAMKSMRWNKLVQAGMCTPTYANDKFMIQLTNSTVVAVLLSGFSTAAMVEGPDFSVSEVYSKEVRVIFQSTYSLSMLASAMYCFGATGVALHSINRISNVLPSKTSVAYMTLNVFFKARDSVNDYIFKGMTTACLGLVTAFVWGNQNIYDGIPAAVISVIATLWFIIVYKNWDKMTTFHSNVADKLCAKDMKLAADGEHSMTEGLWDA